MAETNTNLLSYGSTGYKSYTGFAAMKSRCHQGCVLSGGSMGECTYLPFLSSRGHPRSLVHDRFLHHQGQRPPVEFAQASL